MPAIFVGVKRLMSEERWATVGLVDLSVLLIATPGFKPGRGECLYVIRCRLALSSSGIGFLWVCREIAENLFDDFAEFAVGGFVHFQDQADYP